MTRSTAVMLLAAMVMFGGAAGTAFAQAQDAPPAALGTQPAVTSPAEAAGPEPPAAQPDLMLQGTMHFRVGNYEEALDDLTKARIRDPRSSLAAYYLGATLTKMQQYSKALPHLMEAVTLPPAVKEAYLELADVYYVLGRNDEALRALASAERENVEPAQTAYLKGLVLVKKRRYPEAEASFEKAKSLDPRVANAADFQVATIYHRLGRQTEARERFSEVAARDPGSDVGQMAKQQADALSKRLQTGQRFQAMVSGQYLYDSNVILKPDNVPAAESISNQSDTALVVTGRLEYAPVLPALYHLRFQYALYLSQYQELKAYDVLSHSFGIAPGRAIGDGSLSVPLNYNMTEVDGKDYLTALGAAPVYVFTPAEGQQAQVMLRYLQKDFRTEVTIPEEDRDSTDLAAGLAWYWLFGQQKGFVNARFEVNQEDATGANWSYLGARFMAGMLYPATDALKLSLGLEAYLQDYTNVHTAFNVKRKDTTVTVTAQAMYALTRRIDAHFQYVYMKDDSNIEVYAFDKHIVGIGLYARF